MELMIASSLYNPLIVPLVGFCVDLDEGLFLLYKYVSGGNLERYLHEKKKGVYGGCSLPWSVRYEVATGIAEAIGYLYNGTDRCVVHRDIKPSNILLSSNKNPKVDKLYGWKTCHNASIVKAMKQQSKDVQNEFDRRLTEIIAQFKEQGWNSNLYYKTEKKKMEKTISVAPIVPTSAISDGVTLKKLSAVTVNIQGNCWGFVLSQTIALQDSTTVNFKIWDTYGQERYATLAPLLCHKYAYST
ncbi:uncharacterized protein LOC141718073 isoform X2 [Apium graveolens]|uniref:uncharacterized protein LOC141718073 isoform X2 n=1 Tax=Apium graveolens TaxID=4045 RepID=UPI003D7A1224